MDRETNVLCEQMTNATGLCVFQQSSMLFEIQYLPLEMFQNPISILNLSQRI